MKLPKTRISSRDNEWYRRFREAAARHRDEVVLEGPKQLSDALVRGWAPIAVARTVPVDEPWSLEFTHALIESLSTTEASQGVIGLFARPATLSLDAMLSTPAPGPIVVLDAIQDPGNVGTIVRLAAAFGAAGIISTPGTADLFAPKTLRASTGLAAFVPTANASPAEVVDAAAHAGVTVFITSADGTETELPPGRCILVLGSEGRGVAEEWKTRARSIRIGMKPGVESLNVAAAAAILLHDDFRRRSS